MRQRTPFQRVDVNEAENLIRDQDVLVLDVRDPAAYGRGHIEGAQHASMATLCSIIGATEKTRPILIYCYRGHASLEYAQVFSDFGFSQVHSLDGGYEAWSKRTAGSVALDKTLQQWLAAQQFPADRVDAVIGNGTTPLMKASHTGQETVVRLLILAGTPLNARNDDGNNALWIACVGNHLGVIDLLIEAGIDIDNRNDNGATALMYAASSGKAEVVERLLAQGADTTPQTLDGFTALDLASTVECLARLRRAGQRASKTEASGANLEAPRIDS